MEKIQFIDKSPTAEEYNHIREQVGWPGYRLSDIKKGLNSSLYCVCAYEDNKIVAMGRVIGDGILVFYIQDIIVLPQYQRQGIGSIIMKKIMKYIIANSANNTIIGLLSASGKEEFYEKYGFIKRPNKLMGCGMVQFLKANE